MEGFQSRVENVERNEKKIIRALLTAFLVTLPEGVGTLELTKGKDWKSGVGDLLASVYNEKNEIAALYVGHGDHGEWSNEKEGNQDSIEHTEAEWLDAIGVVHDSARGRDGVRACRAHTHPNQTMELDGYLLGPSGADIRSELAFVREFNKTIENFKLDFPVQITGAAFDPYGVWYYEADHNADSNPEFSKAIEGSDILRLYADMTNEVFGLSEYKDRVEKIQEWLPKIQEYYRQIRVKVRFVSHYNLENEPPCAGASYGSAK